MPSGALISCVCVAVKTRGGTERNVLTPGTMQSTGACRLGIVTDSGKQGIPAPGHPNTTFELLIDKALNVFVMILRARLPFGS